MAIQYDNGPRGDHGFHCGSLLRVSSDGEEALPVGALRGWQGAIVLEPGRRDVNGLNDRSDLDLGLIHRG